ncbi:hypothetical protein SAMN05216201_10955 [Pseudomonas linyingensis]|uniref:RecT family protein n=1 Tax=Pseudomonas linyingensis TaxID=915471 RepID=A0A1H6Z038_9PSED|nr:recombinase RecT [Pseudomonas linyingensis]SEJ46036.1 hypothetical protein SAMN05216201_10955 [Pseudomonas linyingensis]
MNQPTTLQQMREPAPREVSMPTVTMGFGSLQSFELMQRAAKVLAGSTLVPTAYRAFKEVKQYGKVTGYEQNAAGLPNCIVALNMAQRMGADPLMVMQNLHIIEGRPSWSSAFIIAAINSCGRYSSLRFELSAPGEPTEVTYTAIEWKNNNKTEVKKKVTVRHQTCKAWAIEKETGERLESPVVSIQMAIDEGWLTKNGSKWQTIPELMLRYRCASFFGRLYAPELLMGLQTAEEANDFIEAEPDGQGGFAVNLDNLRSQAGDEPAPPPVPDAEDEPIDVDTSTGEIRSHQDAAEPEPAATEPAAKPAAKPKAQQQAADLDGLSFE